MKNNGMRNGTICVLAAAALLLGGCAQGQGKMSYIGADAAKKQILAEVGLTESQVKINSVDMATKNGMDYYQVEFSDDKGNTYRYDIDALTGKVIESAAAGETAAETSAVAETTASQTGAAVGTMAAAAETTARQTDVAAGQTDTAAETIAAAAETTASQTGATAETKATAAALQAAAGGNAVMLTEEEAKLKALSHKTASEAGSSLTFVYSKLEWDDGKQVYDMVFSGGGKKYEYEIDAYSGEVLSVDIDIEPMQMQSQTASAGGRTAGNETAGSQTTGSQTAGNQTASQPSGNGTAAGKTGLTADEAKAKALAHAGLSAPQVTFTKTKSDWDDGRAIYEIDFYGSDGTEYEYEIDANTGDVVKYDTEAPKRQVYEQPTTAAAGSGSMLSADAAKKLALDQVPGATVNDIAEFETDRDDGRVEYEGKIYYGGMEYEFEIDAYSGAFRKWECEYDDDHHGLHH